MMGQHPGRAWLHAEALLRRLARRTPRRPDPPPLASGPPAARGPARAERPRTGHVVQARVVLLAVVPTLRAHVVLGLRSFRIEAVTIHDRAELFARVAERQAPLVLGEQFDGVSAARLLAMIRTAGWMMPVVVMGSGPGLPVLARTLAPVAVVRDPVLGSTSATNPWIRSCIESFVGASG